MRFFIILTLLISHLESFTIQSRKSNRIFKLRINHSQPLDVDYEFIKGCDNQESNILNRNKFATRNHLFKLLGRCLLIFVITIKNAVASGGGIPTEVTPSDISPIQGATLWGALFIISATLHSAESAITKISPWKVQQFIDEEGPSSPFATLLNNMTSLLSTILVITTACSIYSTGLFFATATAVFPNVNLGFLTAILTIVTLFLGELLPKALAVSNSELVARKMVPIINRLSLWLLPITSTMTSLSNFLLKVAGMRHKEETNVTENMLRLVVNEAERSEGIRTDEGRMIKAVLDMQDTDVSRIMQPRVDIVALPEKASASKILETALSTRYSRIPVYKDDIDNIIGVVFSKDLLLYMSTPSNTTVAISQKDGMFNGWSNREPPPERNEKSESWNSLSASRLMQPTYFIPESMKAWDALQEMKKRRIHMAIVVDEYGGTSGLVTFEDILEEVVGEIYDEDDSEEQADDSKTIFKNMDGSFTLRGYAELDDVCEALGLTLDTEIMGESSTIGGLLCVLAGQIPKAGDHLRLVGYDFEVVEIEDNRRIVELNANKVEDIEKSNNPDTELVEAPVTRVDLDTILEKIVSSKPIT